MGQKQALYSRNRAHHSLEAVMRFADVVLKLGKMYTMMLRSDRRGREARRHVGRIALDVGPQLEKCHVL
jgi:hypothetical protein